MHERPQPRPQTTTRGRTVPALAALAAAGLPAACERGEDRTAGQQVDAAIASAQRQADTLRDQARDGVERVKDAAGNAVDAGKQGAAALADRVGDAAITAKVNAALLGDAQLSAPKIDVDTHDGVVTISAPAPDGAARDRAAAVAAATEGVVRVENRSTVGAS